MRNILFFAALLWAFAAQSAGLNQIGSSQPPAWSFYWNFINSQAAAPPGWTVTRAACAGSVSSCVTNAQYNDAAGASYITYSANNPIFSPRGIGSFENRTNYLFPSENPTTTTTGTIPTGYYVLICNGSGSILSAAVTGTGSGLGTLNCSSTYQTFQVTVAGTFIFTVTGTVNWADVQGPCLYANSACGPTPHIITTSGTSTRPADAIKFGVVEVSTIQAGNSSVVLEYYSTSSGATNQISLLGSPINGLQISPIDAGNANKCTSTIANVANLATSGSNQSLFTTNRVAATNLKKGYNLSCNGGASTASSSTSATSFGVSLQLGNGNALYYCNCWISQIKIWPIVLPNPLLQLYSTAGVRF
jgi:hypothetical protein